ncbi:aminotransferase class V-fold PLP-dependent enzyme [Eremococcus coleocola]|uniref:Cysteine desulfurase n=1 Tax=Eremococcus coleocola ACS-139-V-Col8 TaxID=908337 RepID=E4KQT9_9LACT|nr:SufS family cysteine desulfurase [Eremococcus coleocola]EFR30668.1 cysteine desulfurase, SufS subfamily [Eremococcus coleocola ACS-139-V-Col8]
MQAHNKPKKIAWPQDQIRQAFPYLNLPIQDQALIYLDTAATSQKPQKVIDKLSHVYATQSANVHRGIYQLADQATQAYEACRQTVADFCGAESAKEILFNGGTTIGLNFLAQSLVKPRMKAGDRILTTRLEHHSNLVPWQVLCQETGSQLHYLKLKPNYQVDLADLQVQLETGAKALVIHHVSNVLGVIQDLKALAELAHQYDCLLIVDGAQAAGHLPLAISDWDVDAYVWSSHKMYGPSGLGLCYLKSDLQDQCRPFFYGGEMIHQVNDYEASYKEGPWKFEGGTPPLAQVLALPESIAFIQDLELSAIQKHELDLAAYARQGLGELGGFDIYSPPGTGILAFNIQDVHPHDAATAYDLEGVALRAGHHCAQVLMRQLQIPACLRVSLGVYNTQAEIDAFLATSQKVKEFFTHGA